MMMSDEYNLLKCNPENLMSRPVLEKPDREPDFVYIMKAEGHLKDWGKLTQIKYSYWFEERVFEYWPDGPTEEDDHPNLYYFMFDPVWGIFCDESYVQDNKNWAKDCKQVHEAIRSHMLEKEIFDG